MSITQKKLSRKLRQDYLKEVDYAFTTLSDSSNILIFELMLWFLTIHRERWMTLKLVKFTGT